MNASEPLSVISGIPARKGNKNKKTRIRHELTQVQLAKALGISDKMVSQIENGFRPPSAEILRNMAEQLGCSADEILGVEKKGEDTNE